MKFVLYNIIFLVSILKLNAQLTGALNFDGSNDYIQSVSPTISGTDLTLQLWVKPNPTQNVYANILSTHSGGGIGYTIEQNAVTNNQYYFGWGNGVGYSSSTVFNLTASIWQHLTIVKNSNTITIYINGIQAATSTGGSTTLNIGSILIIGDWVNHGRFWGGTMDDIRIWDKALSLSEIQSNYSIELTGSEANLKTYYMLNQGLPGGANGTGCPSGSPCIKTSLDFSVTNNVGTLNNFALSGATSNWVAGAPITSLPVDFISFSAAKMGNEVLLSWKTVAEINNHSFEIQYSKDGVNWDSIGFVSGTGNSVMVQSYCYYHTSPNWGVNYYRLKQNDFDNKTEYSKSIILNIDSDTEIFKLYPNPTKEKISIFYSSSHKGNLSIALIDLLGSTIQQHNVIKDEGAFEIAIDLSEVNPGFYNVELMDGSEMLRQKLIIE